jgi:regulator of sigma E protease
MITTVLAFLFTLGVLVVVHEYGHYRVAVACGVKVLRFSVGFGQVLWRRQSRPDATEFVLCALPLGGYVRMLDEREGPVDASELHRAFNRKPLWARSAIVVAGPLANLLLAIVLFAAAHWIGVDEPKAVLGAPPAGSVVERAGLQAGDWVQALAQSDGEGDGAWDDVRSFSDLRWRLAEAAMQKRSVALRVSERDGQHIRTAKLDFSGFDPATADANLMQKIGLPGPFSEPVLGEVKAGGAAAAAGLRQGDRVLELDGGPVADAPALRLRIRDDLHDGRGLPQQWLVLRDGRQLHITVTPRPSLDADKPIGRIDAFVGSAPEFVKVRLGPIEGLKQGAARTWEVSALTVKMLGRMIVGQASLKNLSGPLTIADYAGQSVQQGLAYYLGFLALVSVSLGVLNLMPLPMLDGGHLMYYIFEGIARRPVSDLWLGRLQRGGMAVLLLMMSVALFNDVTRLLGLH